MFKDLRTNLSFLRQNVFYRIALCMYYKVWVNTLFESFYGNESVYIIFKAETRNIHYEERKNAKFRRRKHTGGGKFGEWYHLESNNFFEWNYFETWIEMKIFFWQKLSKLIMNIRSNLSWRSPLYNDHFSTSILRA